MTGAPDLIPDDWWRLPNPRGFRPVALAPVEYFPSPAVCPVPLDAATWPMGEVFIHKIRLSDGCTLRARMFLPTGVAQPRWLLLLHMWGMDADSWNRRAPGFLDDLSELDFAWCAIDFRWHGESEGEPHCARYADWVAARQLPMPERGEVMARLSVQGPPLGANVQFLRDLWEVRQYCRASGRIDPERWGIIGGSVGANAAWVASAMYDATRHVCISPYYPAPGFTLMGREVSPFTPRDVLFVTDQEERREALRMAALTTGDPEVLSSEGREHGLGLLRQPVLRRRVLAWLRGI
ncbi:MAG: hypothetical protein GEEBNDBF_01802 [bacterium]|nr:hypothetical protein [bacterium]